MATSDTVVGIVGAVVLTAAMVAVFYYENANVDDRPAGAIGDGGTAYDFQYQRTTGVVALDQTATLAIDGTASQTYTFTLPSYVWAVNFTLTWTETETAPGELGQVGGVTGGDQFRLDVLKETGDPLQDPVAGRSGNLEIVHVHEGASMNETSRPGSMTVTVFADSQGEAHDTLENATRGQGKHGEGNWTVTVTLVDVGENEAIATPQADPGNEFTLRVVYDYWEPVLQTDDTPPAAFVDMDALVRRVAGLF